MLHMNVKEKGVLPQEIFKSECIGKLLELGGTIQTFPPTDHTDGLGGPFSRLGPQGFVSVLNGPVYLVSKPAVHLRRTAGFKTTVYQICQF